MAALSGIKVLDLTRLLPGPFASLVLADLGAQVDKLEDSGAGDYTRNTPPMVGDLGAAFRALNRGKRSLVLDLKNPKGASALKRLAKHYDVLFEQFRPGVMDRLGVGHQALLEENPALVICALTGYGQTGPLANKAGHDLNYMARAGLMGLQGPAEGAPQIPAFQLADVSGGLWSVVGILAALREREQTGKGQVVDIAMIESVVPFATISLSRLFGGEMPERGNEFLTGGIAAYNTYQTSDGEAITLGALEPKFLMAFFNGIGKEPDLNAVFPGPHQAEMKQMFSEIFASKTRAEWERFSEEHDCCLEPVLRPDELYEDPHLKARGVFFETDAGQGSAGQYRTPVTPRDFEAGPAPRQGEHTEQVLSESGFSSDEIAELRAVGAVR